MADITVNGNNLKVRAPLRMTNGSFNAYTISFEFSEEWNDLAKIAMFRTEKSVSIYCRISDTNECVVPWEVLISYDTTVLIEVCGMIDGQIVLPTIWAQLGPVVQGLTSSASFPSSIGGGGGTTDHTMLTNRDAADQHTLGSVTGLTEAVMTIPPPTIPMSNSEIDNIIGGG